MRKDTITITLTEKEILTLARVAKEMHEYRGRGPLGMKIEWTDNFLENDIEAAIVLKTLFLESLKACIRLVQ